MLLGPGFWMRFQKMVKHVEKGQNMLLVDTRLGGADVINDHVTDFFRDVLLVR
jgi:arginine repressor